MADGASVTVRPFTIDDEADLRAYCDIIMTVTPERPASPEECRWAEATYPGGVRCLALLDGSPIGTGSTGRIYMYEADHEDFWLSIEVLPHARRRGAGTALLAVLSDHARRAGKTGFQTDVSAARPETIDFLEHRGFREVERSASVRLDLDGLPEPAIAAPAGITITTLEERPDLLPSIHAVAVATFPDIPHADAPITAGTLEEFRRRDIDRPGVSPGGIQVALDAATGAVVGFAVLAILPGSTRVAWHDMTAVLAPWRGRGIAGALKRATIAWALRTGLTALDTSNDVANAPMRAVNARLGYRPLPDDITLRGPLASPVGGAGGDVRAR